MRSRTFPGSLGKQTLVSVDGTDVTDAQRARLEEVYGLKGRWVDVYASIKTARKALDDALGVLTTCTYSLDYMQGQYAMMQGAAGVVAVLPTSELRFGSL